MLEPKTKARKTLSQRERIVALLEERGERGATSEELNPIAFRYSAVIFELRKRGYNIETRDRKGTDLARFILWSRPGPMVQQEMFE